MKERIKDYFSLISNKNFLKSIAILLISQGILYYFVKYLQFDYHTINSSIDNKIPFIPYFIYFYNFFYPFVFLTFYYVFCKDLEKYYQGISAGIIGFVISNIIFIIYPTIMVLRPEINNIDVVTDFIIKATYFLDNPALNCFPSIHCLFCFQVILTTILSKNIKFKYKSLITKVSFLIIMSTVLVKQHYFLDILGALIICIIANIIVYLLKVDTKLFKNYLN